MVYKVLIVKNRFKGKIKLQKYLDWFKSNTPIEIVTEEISTDLDVETQAVSNGTFTGVIVKNTILPKLREIIPENKYHAIAFIYGNYLAGIRVGVCDGVSQQDFLYKNTSVIQLCKTDDNGKQLNHELFHSFFHKLRRNGTDLNDPMDTYIKNDVFNIDKTIDTNREIALQNLSSHWEKICSFNSQPTFPTTIALLVRKTTDSKQTLGDMIAIKNGDLYLCKSLEREEKVRIPAGMYQVDWTFSPKFQRNMYLIRVPGIEGIRIHLGNYAEQSEGCVMLGKTIADINGDEQLDIANSKLAIAEFEQFFSQKPFTLLVI